MYTLHAFIWWIISSTPYFTPVKYFVWYTIFGICVILHFHSFLWTPCWCPVLHQYALRNHCWRYSNIHMRCWIRSSWAECRYVDGHLWSRWQLDHGRYMCWWVTYNRNVCNYRNFQRDVTAWIGWQRSHHGHPRCFNKSQLLTWVNFLFFLKYKKNILECIKRGHFSLQTM